MKTPIQQVTVLLVWTALMVSCKDNTESEMSNESIHTDKTFTNEGITNESDTLLRGEGQYLDTVNAVREKETPSSP
jgi:hypothetical protein